MIGNGGWEVHRRWRWSGRLGKMFRGGGREVEVDVGDGGPWRRKVVEEEEVLNSSCGSGARAAAAAARRRRRRR